MTNQTINTTAVNDGKIIHEVCDCRTCSEYSCPHRDAYRRLPYTLGECYRWKAVKGEYTK